MDCVRPDAGARAASAIAGSTKAERAGGGTVSSGRRPIPTRANARPTAGQAVTTASGIASAGPAARNSA